MPAPLWAVLVGGPARGGDGGAPPGSAPEARVRVVRDGAEVELALPRKAVEGEPWWRPFVKALEACDAGHPEREEARLLAGKIQFVGEALRGRDDAANSRVEGEYGGPGPMGDLDDLEDWVEKNPTQAGDLLDALCLAMQEVGS